MVLHDSTGLSVYLRMLIQRYKAMTHFYEIRIKGHLDAQWQDWFDGMSVTLEADETTLLSGLVPDQPALYGLLRKVRDLGLPLVSLNRIRPGKPYLSSTSLEKEK